MAGRLEGKVAVITGAGSGIGAAMAEMFCREGAKVIAADISGQQDAVAKRIGSNCIPFQADVSKSADVQAMLQAAITHFGKLNVLVNNAAIDGGMVPTGEYSEEEFDRVWAINGRSVFLGMRYGIPLMLKSGGGAIVNTSSMAQVVAFPTMTAYCASKGAVGQMTKVAAVEYAKQGIRANVICPGPITTGITAHMPAEYIEAVKNAVPLHRMADASEVAHLGVFLASDESSFITGSSILIDGGYTSL
ncbi:MAG: SDR family NAD(P)-dependent oxidoreductase [Rhodocyclaceae bacterium]|nr:SDR family NAD(P)-dependent oxidoreductase [Rhodocyclaceae bacterium]